MVEQWAELINSEKRQMDTFTEREKKFLQLSERFIKDMLYTYGTVKIGFTSQTTVQVRK